MMAQAAQQSDTVGPAFLFASQSIEIPLVRAEDRERAPLGRRFGRDGLTLGSPIRMISAAKWTLTW